jgi:hypothetical protein
VGNALTVLGLPTQIDPALQREIDRLRAVETHVEAGVIPSWIGDDELPLVMNQHVGPDTVFLQLGRGDGAGFVTEELVAVSGVGREPV